MSIWRLTMATTIPKIVFKRGDNFKLDITVTDPNNDTAEAALLVLTTAQTDLTNAQAYLAYLEALVPPVQVDIDAQQAIVNQLVIDVAAAQATYDAAVIVDITNWTITSKLMWCGKVVQDFEITITNASLGTFNVRAYEVDTILWTPRLHEMDILFTRAPEGGTSSETMHVDVQRGATNG
jgi:hypothetical protein